MKAFGISLALIGTIVVAVAFFLMPSTVSTEEMTSLPYTGAIIGSGHFTDTYNMPRAQLREMVVQLGEVLFLGGLLLFAAGRIEEGLKLGQQAEAIDADQEAARNKIIAAIIFVVAAGGLIAWLVTVDKSSLSSTAPMSASQSADIESAAENASRAADDAMNAAMNAADNATRALR